MALPPVVVLLHEKDFTDVVALSGNVSLGFFYVFFKGAKLLFRSFLELTISDCSDIQSFVNLATLAENHRERERDNY